MFSFRQTSGKAEGAIVSKLKVINWKRSHLYPCLFRPFCWFLLLKVCGRWVQRTFWGDAANDRPPAGRRVLVHSRANAVDWLIFRLSDALSWAWMHLYVGMCRRQMRVWRLLQTHFISSLTRSHQGAVLCFLAGFYFIDSRNLCYKMTQIFCFESLWFLSVHRCVLFLCWQSVNQ